MQNSSSQYTQNTPQRIIKKPPLPSSLILLCCFPRLHGSLKGSVNEFQTISRIEIYWQNSNEPALFPARLRRSHCPECSEHMLLSSAACLTAKGWFNYINCLMTEERAAGPCMLVCDKRETLLRRGPHYTSLTVTWKTLETVHNTKHVFLVSFREENWFQETNDAHNVSYTYCFWVGVCAVCNLLIYILSAHSRDVLMDPPASKVST